MESSLQRAATSRRGEFEATFAGFDLSEFDHGGGSAKHPSVSHSAERLRAKQAEDAKMLQQEQEEDQLHTLLCMRAEKRCASEKASFALFAPCPDSGMPLVSYKKSRGRVIGDVIMRIHGTERSDEPRQKLAKEKRRIRRSTTKADLKSVKQTSGNKSIFKKAKRNKY